MSSIRAGIGFDVHQLVDGRRLVLGGLDIPHEKGLLGHSDADVLSHAIMDALLGAIGEGDIGRHFPDSDPAYRGISSLKLMEKVRNMMSLRGASLLNLDATIICQAPRLSPLFPQMLRNIAETLMVDESRLNLKATTTEGLGFTGRGEGIAAQAVATVCFQPT